MASNVVDQLYRQPPRSRAPKSASAIGAYSLGPRVAQQADLLVLPKDPATGDRYALVVVDLATRATDAVPLKRKTAAAVLKGFETIHARAKKAKGQMAAGLGGWPDRLEVDGGSEFRGPVSIASKKAGTHIRVGRPGRHQQQAVAEVRNRTIGSRIGKLQAARELLTDQPELEWVADLQKIIADINRKHLRTKEQMDAALASAREANMPVGPVGPGSEEEYNILPEGTVVRVINEKDKPTDARGENITGRRRAGDPVFSPKSHVVADVVLTPGQVPRYKVNTESGRPLANAFFQRRELQVVRPNEVYPRGKDVETKMMRERGLFIPQKLHGSRKRAGTKKVKEYRVQWRGYPESKDWTWATEADLRASAVGKKMLKAQG